MKSTGQFRVTAFRGEHGEPDKTTILQSRHGSYSFGTLRAAEHYANNPNDISDVIIEPRIIKAELTINKPVMNNPRDPFMEFSDIEQAIGLEKAVHIAKMLDVHIFGTDNWARILDDSFADIDDIDDIDDRKQFNAWIAEDPSLLLSKIYINAYKILDEEEWIGWFKEKGFDGAVHQGSGETLSEAEYKIFDSSQANIIKIICLKSKLEEFYIS